MKEDCFSPVTHLFVESKKKKMNMAVTGASEQAKKRPFTMEGETIHKRLVGKDMSDALNAARELKEGI